MFEIGAVMAVIVGLGQLYKKMELPVKYLPLVNVVLGLGAGFFYLDASTVQSAILNGLMVGLGASGLYDLSYTVTKK